MIEKRERTGRKTKRKTWKEKGERVEHRVKKGNERSEGEDRKKGEERKRGQREKRKETYRQK